MRDSVPIAAAKLLNAICKVAPLVYDDELLKYIEKRSGKKTRADLQALRVPLTAAFEAMIRDEYYALDMAEVAKQMDAEK